MLAQIWISSPTQLRNIFVKYFLFEFWICHWPFYQLMIPTVFLFRKEVLWLLNQMFLSPLLLMLLILEVIHPLGLFLKVNDPIFLKLIYGISCKERSSDEIFDYFKVFFILLLHVLLIFPCHAFNPKRNIFEFLLVFTQQAIHNFQHWLFQATDHTGNNSIEIIVNHANTTFLQKILEFFMLFN